MTNETRLAHAAAIFKRLGDAYFEGRSFEGVLITLEVLTRLLDHVAAEYIDGGGAMSYRGWAIVAIERGRKGYQATKGGRTLWALTIAQLERRIDEKEAGL